MNNLQGSNRNMKLHIMKHLGEILIASIVTLCMCIMILSRDEDDDNEKSEDSE